MPLSELQEQLDKVEAEMLIMQLSHDNLFTDERARTKFEALEAERSKLRERIKSCEVEA